MKYKENGVQSIVEGFRCCREKVASNWRKAIGKTDKVLGLLCTTDHSSSTTGL